MTDPKDSKEARRALGARLAALRIAAGFTQVTFGKAIQHSRSTIANVETGMQNVQRDFWQRCDELLRPHDGSLAGEHDRILQLRQEQRRDLLLAAFGDDEQPDDWTSWLRQTVLNRTAPTGPPPTVAALEAALHAGNTAYQGAQYSQLRRLPKIIGFAELLISDPPTSDLPRLARMITGAYLLASKLGAKLGDGDIAWTAADRATSFSLMTGDPAYTALAGYQTACALAKQPGRLADAESAAVTAADRIASHRLAATPAGISARGALLLHAAIAAARQQQPRQAQAYLHDAAKGADELGHNANEMWTAFGPANVMLHRISVAVALRDTPSALRFADTIDTSDLPAPLVSRRAQVHLDLGTAYAAAGDADPQTMLHLLEFERIAPEAIALNAAANTLIRTLLARERLSQTPGLRALAHRAGVSAL